MVLRSKPARLDRRGGMETTSFFAKMSFTPESVLTTTLTQELLRSVAIALLLRNTSARGYVSLVSLDELPILRSMDEKLVRKVGSYLWARIVDSGIE